MTSVATAEHAVAPRDGDEPGPTARRERPDRSFLAWGAAGYVVVLAAITLLALRRTDGHLVYVLDDPAIHQSVAGNLLHHGTWGVEAGHFESASSSPLWTLLLAAWLFVSPFDDVGPLVLNVAAALALVAVLGANQRVLRPSWRRPMDALGVVVVVVVALFLPALTLVGMEHVLHMALTLGAVVLFHRRAAGEADRWHRWLPYLVLGLATATRLETAFVAVGLAVAFAAQALPGWGPGGGAAPLRPQLRRGVLIGLAAAVPIALTAAGTRLMGQGLMPNSVSAKSQVNRTETSLLRASADRLTSDPLLAVLVALALVTLVLAWRQSRRSTFPAIVTVVSVVLHVLFARVGWYERYQGYLVALGVYTAFEVVAESLGAERLRVRPALAGLLVLAMVPFSANKLNLTVDAPLAASDTYQQRYQAARFLSRYYQGEPVATGELGYVTLMHDGPITDFFGLGDYEVLEERRASGDHPTPAYWDRLADERGFEVVAIYPSTLLYQVPDDWLLAGQWTLHRRVISAFEPTFEFWVTKPEALTPLQDHLREFAADMPDGVTVEVNEGAQLQAMAQLLGPGETLPTPDAGSSAGAGPSPGTGASADPSGGPAAGDPAGTGAGGGDPTTGGAAGPAGGG